MISSSDPRHAARQAIDEILGLVLIAFGQLGNLALGVLVGQRAVTNERHRINLDVIATTNSMRASPTPSAGMRHQRKAAAGLARLSITCVRVSGMPARSSSLAS